MRLDRLLEEAGMDGTGAPALGPGAAGIEVGAVVHDSAAVTPGSLFCCVPGARADGHRFAVTAVEAGAVALVVEHRLPLAVPQVVVASVRAAMAHLAAAFHHHPSTTLAVVGVTGTNGKTTTAHLLGAVLEAHGWPTAVMGTLTGTRTTPEAPELQAGLARCRDDGGRAVVLEVSSHALALHRVDAVRFAAAVFTNLSQDHLDFHGTMEAYFQAKASLFVPDRAAVAAVNADDPWGRRLLAGARLPAFPFSLADAVDLATGSGGGPASTFRWRGQPVGLRLPGRFNVMNALAAAAAAEALGVAPAAVAEGLSSVAAVPGRFEVVVPGPPFSVVVDYAHTPVALEQALDAARGLAAAGPGRVLVVFGCGGHRDRAKRPLMGEAATRLADRAYLTSDNPRDEDPLAIIAEVRAGATAGASLVVEPDRAAAIGLALGQAQPGDVVLIAGKGHETGQDMGGVASPFDDRAVARHLLAAR